LKEFEDKIKELKWLVFLTKITLSI
jgi:hypothetical protein